MLFVMQMDTTFCLLGMRLLGPQTVVLHTEGLPYPIKQARGLGKMGVHGGRDNHVTQRV